VANLADPTHWETSILRATGRLLMLAALEERPGHGYDLARRLSGLCGSWCHPSPAMIYPAIRELEAAGLVHCDDEPSDPRGRRVCHLTDAGREALAVGLTAWGRFLPVLERLVAGTTGPCEAGRAADSKECGP